MSERRPEKREAVSTEPKPLERLRELLASAGTAIAEEVERALAEFEAREERAA